MFVWSMSVTTGSIVDRAVDLPELPRGGLGLGQVVGDVLLVEEDLALEVVRLDEVAVDDPDVADARADQVVGQHGPERPAAADRDPAGHQLALAGLAQRGEADLAAVAVERVDGAADIAWLRGLRLRDARVRRPAVGRIDAARLSPRRRPG